MTTSIRELVRIGDRGPAGIVNSPGPPRNAWTYTSNTFNNEGRLTNFTYPLNADNYQHGFDSMSRLVSLTNVTTSTTLAKGATYNASSQLTGLNYGPSLGWAESRTYDRACPIFRQFGAVGRW